MLIIKHKNIFFAAILALMVAAGVFTVIWQPTLSVEFTGGSVVEVAYNNERPIIDELGVAIVGAKLQPLHEKSLLVRTKDLSPTEREQLLSELTLGGRYPLTETRFSSIGPSVGSELRSKAIVSIILVLALVIIFVAIAFRSVGKIVSSWKYGLVVVITLIHDIIVPTGVFVVLSHYFIGYEIDTLFVTALLAILGYSVADTIVVFDRIRENLKAVGTLKSGPTAKPDSTFESIVGRSLGETYVRSINTSLTTILAALAIFFFGGEATKHFALMLAIGIAAGTYSSILLASPLLFFISVKSKATG